MRVFHASSYQSRNAMYLSSKFPVCSNLLCVFFCTSTCSFGAYVHRSMTAYKHACQTRVRQHLQIPFMICSSHTVYFLRVWQLNCENPNRPDELNCDHLSWASLRESENGHACIGPSSWLVVCTTNTFNVSQFAVLHHCNSVMHVYACTHDWHYWTEVASVWACVCVCFDCFHAVPVTSPVSRQV